MHGMKIDIILIKMLIIYHFWIETTIETMIGVLNVHFVVDANMNIETKPLSLMQSDTTSILFLFLILTRLIFVHRLNQL